MCRLAPEVVAARQAMLDRCLVSIVQGPAPFNQAAPLLAFLAPPESHWQVSGQAGSGPGRRAAHTLASREGTQPPGSGSSASSSRDTGPKYGHNCSNCSLFSTKVHVGNLQTYTELTSPTAEIPLWSRHMA